LVKEVENSIEFDLQNDIPRLHQALNQVVMRRITQHFRTKPEDLDAIFRALGNTARRTMLARLARGKASMKELADLLTISQPAVTKHLKVLKRAGLVEWDEENRYALRRLKLKRLAEAAEWLEPYRKMWEKKPKGKPRAVEEWEREG
jgi:DNA-binding transcriptional ArsR family regulator